jgi:rubrerythrin
MPGDGDLISRRSLLRNILKRLGIKGQDYLTAQESVIVDCIYQERSIESAPGAEKRGWVSDGDPCELVCNNCGYRVLIYNSTNYCPNCGNYNGGNQDEI